MKGQRQPDKMSQLSSSKCSSSLFLDNALCHPPDMKRKYDQIKIVSFPPNCTSILQPLDLEKIQAFKLKYMKVMLTNVASRIDECTCATDLCKTVDLLQAMRWLGKPGKESVYRQLRSALPWQGSSQPIGASFHFPRSRTRSIHLQLTQVNALLKESSDILMQYCIFDLICTEPLNRDTPLIWTIAMVPSVSVLTGFDCIICQSAKFYPILPKETREAYVKMTRHWT